MKVNSQIRNLKKTLSVHVEPINYKLDESSLNEKWKFSINLIEEILNNGNINFCYQELYQTINDLIFFEIPTHIVDRIQELFKTQAQTTVYFLNSLLNISTISDFFSKFNSFWKKITQNFILLTKILTKFEKKYFSLLGSSLHQGSIWALFLDNLKSILNKENSFISILIDKLLFKISLYRESIYSQNEDKDNVIMSENLDEIQEGINLLWETGLYKEKFNDIFLNSSLDYFSNLSYVIIENQNIEDYISFVEKTFQLENKLITNFLNDYTSKKMINNLETKFIFENKTKILNKLFLTSNENLFIDIKMLELIKRIYLLFKRIKIEEYLRKSWLSYLDTIAVNIFKEFSKTYTVVKFFENIKNLKKNIDETVEVAFLNDDKFKSTAKEGFVKTLNLKPNAVADSLSRYVDHILTDSDVEEKCILGRIDDFMSVFKYLDAKDMFESFHIKKLANRLLYNLTNSTEGEKYLIEKLRSECGNVFVTKSEEMLADIQNSMDMTLNCKFNKSENSEKSEDILKLESNFYVFSTYAWPINKIITGFVDNSIINIQKYFTQFYKAKFAGKSLKWHLPWCSGELSYNINNKNILLQVNGVQAAILVRYTKTKTSISLKDLLNLTSLEKEDLLYNLSILSNNYHILSYDKPNDSYKLDFSFSPNKTHLIINDFSNKEETSIEEIKEVEERNWEDRKHVIDALLMKTLKSKKQLKINDLITNVLSMIKFPCEISMVETRINSLISNGYLTQDDKDTEIVKYNP